MSPTARGFVLAALIYFVVGMALGITMLIWPQANGVVEWPHVHFQLVGWVSMMIFGVAYHILPRFAGNPLWSEGTARVHLWIGNLGLVGLASTVGGQGAARLYGSPEMLPWVPIAAAFGALVFAGGALFVLNIFMSMRPRQEVAAPAEVSITPEMSIGEIADRYPGTLPVFVAHGMGKIRDPIFRRFIGRNVSVKLAASKHGLDPSGFVAELSAAAEASRAVAAPAAAAGGVLVPPAARSAAPREAPSGEAGGPVTADLSTGEVTERWPATREVFSRHFGPGCFECPAFGNETVREACMLHGTDLATFVGDLNRAAAAPRAAAPSGGAKGSSPGARPEGPGDGIEERRVNDLVRDHPQILPLLARHGIDTCCGGSLPLGEAARRHGIAVEPLVREVRREIVAVEAPGR